MTTTTEKPGQIFPALAAIMAEVPNISKDRKNTGQGYNFRGIDDVYNAINPIMAKHGVFMLPEVLDVKREERAAKSGGTMSFVQVHVRYHFTAKDGSSVSAESAGEGMDSGDKATAKAMSGAQKYAIFQTFLVPTADAKDSECDNPEPAYVEPKANTAPPRAVEMITPDQRLVIKKLIDDKQVAGEDVEVVVGKVCDYYGVKTFPTDLTKSQADEVIKRWSAKKASK